MAVVESLSYSIPIQPSECIRNAILPVETVEYYSVELEQQPYV
jgi:hypothetical protein